MSDVEVVSGVASITQDRKGVITEGTLNITMPVTGTYNATKSRQCMFVDPITGDLVGYTSKNNTGYTTCPRGYAKPCTEVVSDDSAGIKCHVQAMGEYVVVQYNEPVIEVVETSIVSELVFDVEPAAPEEETTPTDPVAPPPAAPPADDPLTRALLAVRGGAIALSDDSDLSEVDSIKSQEALDLLI